MNVATAICPVSAAGMRRNPWLLYLPHSPPSANVNGTFYMFLKSVPFPIGPALVQPLNQPLPGLLHVPLDCLGAFMPSVCLFGKRPEVLFETSCSGSIVHSRCLYGHRLKAIIMQGL